MIKAVAFTTLAMFMLGRCTLIGLAKDPRHQPPTQFKSIPELFEKFNDYPAAEGQFKMLDAVNGIPHVQLSNITTDDQAKDQRDEATRRTVIDGIFQTFIHTGAPAVKITAFPLLLDTATKQKRPLTKTARSIQITRAEALEILRKEAGISDFADLSGDEIDGRFMADSYTKTADRCMYNDQGAPTLDRIYRLFELAEPISAPKDHEPLFSTTMPQKASTFTLEIKAEIDGSDVVTITRQGLTWTHKGWGWPADVRVNDALWVPKDRRFLPAIDSLALLDRADFSRVRVIDRSGRDIVGMETVDGGIRVYFADTPPGPAPYQIKLEFPGSQVEQSR